jgi:hypothetical protein
LIIRYVCYVSQYKCEVVGFHRSIHSEFVLMYATINPVANLASVVLRNPRRRVYANNITTSPPCRAV